MRIWREMTYDRRQVNYCVTKAGAWRHSFQGPLTRNVKLRFAHAPGMPGTFFRAPWVSDPDMHQGTCVTHVPWCMSGSLINGFLWSGSGVENVPGVPGACATRIFTYLVRCPNQWLWNSAQNILPIHWKLWFLYNTEIFRALRFKSP